jgi:hypothetical protein
METSFQQAKPAVADAACLAHPAGDAEISLMVDASAFHIGAVLQKRPLTRDPWTPLGFFSKKLEAAQVKYSAFDRELWACFSGIRHFRYMLEGWRFAIFTDHKPLTFALSKTSYPWTARQCRQLAYIAEFTSGIRHIAGADNIIADMLSRPSPPRTSPPSPSPPSSTPSPAPRVVAAVASAPGTIDFTAVAAHQLDCHATQRAQESSSLKVELLAVGSTSLLCDTSRGLVRPIIPLVDRRAVFTAIHGLDHPGIGATCRLLVARVVWHGMSANTTAGVMIASSAAAVR